MAGFNVVVLPGDGVGPEVTEQSVRVLQEVCRIEGIELVLNYETIGYEAYLKEGAPFSSRTAQKCRAANAVLVGTVGDRRSIGLASHLKPEAGLLALRAKLGLFTNLRPITLLPSLAKESPIKDEITGNGFNMIIVRELCGGIYFGAHGFTKVEEVDAAYDTEIYTANEVERVAKNAFEIARQRKKHIVSIDKANVLESSRLWRATVERVAVAYPDVTLESMYIDNAAMQILLNPSQFDVLLTTNLFGDILAGEASALAGSAGVFACASLGYSKLGAYEPSHGSQEEIAHKNTANPLASILSVGMMFRYSFELPSIDELINKAVNGALDQARTPDIKNERLPVIGTREMGDRVIVKINEILSQ